MEFKEFKDLIEKHLWWENKLTNISEIMNCNLYDADWIDYTEKLFDKILKDYFDNSNIDIIYWWMYEHTDKNKEAMWDKDGNVIPMKTIEDLYNYVSEKS